MNDTIVPILIITGIMIMVYYLGTKQNTEVIYVTSEFDKRQYLVRNLEDKEEAAYLLGIVSERINILRTYLMKNINSYPDFSQYIRQFDSKIKNLILY